MSNPEDPITLSQIYFYIVIVLFVLVALFFQSSSEDIKDPKRFKKYIKLTLFIGSLGIIMELLQWTFLCPFQSILFTFLPFITLIVLKGIIYFFKKMSNIEPYEIYKGKLTDRIWKTKGNLKYKNYYRLYSTIIQILPITIFLFLFLLLKENTCK